MKKKTILALLFAATITTVAVVACSEKVNEAVSELNRGKADGEAFCECMKALDITTNCSEKFGGTIDFTETDMTKWSNYQRGVLLTECNGTSIFDLLK